LAPCVSNYHIKPSQFFVICHFAVVVPEVSFLVVSFPHLSVGIGNFVPSLELRQMSNQVSYIRILEEGINVFAPQEDGLFNVLECPWAFFTNII
jgi:hypothetical protein